HVRPALPARIRIFGDEVGDDPGHGSVHRLVLETCLDVRRALEMAPEAARYPHRLVGEQGCDLAAFGGEIPVGVEPLDPPGQPHLIRTARHRPSSLSKSGPRSRPALVNKRLDFAGPRLPPRPAPAPPGNRLPKS